MDIHVGVFILYMHTVYIVYGINIILNSILEIRIQESEFNLFCHLLNWLTYKDGHIFFHIDRFVMVLEFGAREVGSKVMMSMQSHIF